MSLKDARLLLLGVDGGATKVAAYQVVRTEETPLSFEVAGGAVETIYPTPLTSTPVYRAQQLSEHNTGRIELTVDECQVGAGMIDTVVSTILRAAEAFGGNLIVGICMPGLKTADHRGIAVMNNGPRIPDFLDRLEQRLNTSGRRLAAPVGGLYSDADCCGTGEEYAEGGKFRDVQHAYYLGGGTGLAEALKLNGTLIRFDDIATWMPKAWQMEHRPGHSFESLIAPGWFNRRYPATASRDPSTPFPEVLAAQGDSEARVILEDAGEALADLVVHRILAILQHRKKLPRRTAHRADDQPLLQRVVLGRHLGRIYGHPELGVPLRDAFKGQLLKRFNESVPALVREHYLRDGEIVPSLVTVSSLDAAPALGAAVTAYLQSNPHSS